MSHDRKALAALLRQAERERFTMYMADHDKTADWLLSRGVRLAPREPLDLDAIHKTPAVQEAFATLRESYWGAEEVSAELGCIRAIVRAGATDHGAPGGPPKGPLAVLRGAVEEVMAWHRDRNSSDYNACEKGACAWCEDVQNALNGLAGNAGPS